MAVAMAVRLEAHRRSVIVEYGHSPEQIFAEACTFFFRVYVLRNSEGFSSSSPEVGRETHQG